jgi:hypothetical protein
MSDSTASPLVVHADPAGARRAFRSTLVLAAVLGVLLVVFIVLLAALALSADGGGSSALLTIAPLCIGLVFVGMVFRTATRRASLDGPVLRLDESGTTWWLPQGELAVPWQAIASVSTQRRGRHQVLTYRLAPGTSPDTPGVRSAVPPAVFAQLSDHGLRLGSAGVDVPVDEIVRATDRLTAGRLRSR